MEDTYFLVPSVENIEVILMNIEIIQVYVFGVEQKKESKTAL